MSANTPLVTAEELERLPNDDARYELVQGRLVRMSPGGFEHGRVVMAFGFLLSRHLHGRRLGIVVAEVGVTLARNPDTVRAPDLAFFREHRIPSPVPRGFLDVPPDLAIEVLSPDDRPREVQERVDEYLGRGVPVVLVVDPAARTVALHRHASPLLVLGHDGRLDLDPVIAGFSCIVREIFDGTDA
jgi:Uma2 family endonuclease